MSLLSIERRRLEPTVFRLVVLLFAGAFLLHLCTLAIAPAIWQDEIQIIEFGRLFLTPEVSYSLLITDPRYADGELLFWLPAVVHELVFELSGGRVFGPRLLSLVAAVLASGALYLWVRERSGSRRLGLLIALALFLDPSFTQSFRGARVESWVFGSVFLACFLLVRSRRSLKTGQVPSPALALGTGLACGFAAFTWPSVVILLPLMVLESWLLLLALLREGLAKFPWKCFLTMVAGVLLMVAAQLAPLYILGYDPLEILGKLGGKSADVGGSLISLDRTLLIFKLLKYSALLVVAAFLASRKWLSWLTLGAGLLLMLQLGGSLYLHRAVYLLPYLLLLLCDLKWPDRLPWNSPRTYAFILLLASLGTGMLASVLYKSVNAYRRLDTVRPAALEETLASLPSRGAPPRVLMIGAHEVYPHARRHGWKLAGSDTLIQLADYKEAGHLPGLMRKVDLVLVDASLYTERLDRYLAPHGFERTATYLSTPNFPVHGELRSEVAPGYAYGPYYLFERLP